MDLSDEIFRHWHKNQRTVILGVRTASKRWHVWNTECQEHIEAYIKYDLGFDGYYVKIVRQADEELLCAEEARWKIVARPR